MHRRWAPVVAFAVASIAVGGLTACQATPPSSTQAQAAGAVLAPSPKVQRYESANDPGALQILYLHGGSYLHEASAFHRALIEDLLPRIDATVTMPVYPLAPAHTFHEAYAEVTAEYRRLVDAHPGIPVAIMGDSAGGGFALGLTEELATTDLPQPSAIVLISPWLDLTLNNPAIPPVDKIDVLLSRKSLVAAGLAWAGGTDPSDYRLSPINGTLTGLPPITVVAGTDDLLYPDVARFESLAKTAGAAVEVHVYEGGDHRFASSATPDGDAARAIIAEALGAAVGHDGTSRAVTADSLPAAE
jgi:monoterpene epsilon-lactone hydrolase